MERHPQYMDCETKLKTNLLQTVFPGFTYFKFQKAVYFATLPPAPEHFKF